MKIDSQTFQPVEPGGHSLSQGDDHAPFAMRAAALLIDIFLLALLVLFFVAVITVVFLLSLPLDFSGCISLIFLYLFLLVSAPVSIAVSYFTILHALGGQTVGKLFLGIRVVTRTLEQVSPGRAFLRLTGYLVSAVPLTVGFIWAGLDKEHSAWHDKLAETRVIIV